MNIDLVAYNTKDEREYLEQVLDQSVIGLSGEEEFLVRKQLRPELEKYLYDSGICPSCGSTKTRTYPAANGPDDFDQVFECLSCGTTAT